MQYLKDTHSKLPTSTENVIQRTIEQSIRKSDENDISIPSPIIQSWTVNMPYLVYKAPVESFHSSLHDTWFTYYQYSKRISAKNPLMDRLALQLLQVRDQGALSRPSNSDNAAEVAMTSDGIIWKDLPFFASDMMEFWTKDCAAMGSLQRINFSCFLAKLASVKLVEDKLSHIFLVVLRDTLETARPLGELNASDDENPSRTLQNISIGDLLPTLLSWMMEAQTRLIHLCHESRNDPAFAALGIGSLYRDDELTSLKLPRFSPERWMFWLRRLDAINQEASDAHKEDLAECTVKIMDQMLFALSLNDSNVRREFDAHADIIKHSNKRLEFLRHGRSKKS